MLRAQTLQALYETIRLTLKPLALSAIQDSLCRQSTLWDFIGLKQISYRQLNEHSICYIYVSSFIQNYLEWFIDVQKKYSQQAINIEKIAATLEYLRFHKVNWKWFDVVVEKNSEKNISSGGMLEALFSVWFARVMCFLRTPLEEN